jgi:signal transduction histidine kinase
MRVPIADTVAVSPSPARRRGVDPFLGIEVLILICAQLSGFFSSDPLRVPAWALSLACLAFSALRLGFRFVRGRPVRIAALIAIEVAMIVALVMSTSDGSIIVLSIAFILRNAELLAPRRALVASVAGVSIALCAMIAFSIARGENRAATIDTALALLMAIGVTGALASFAASERRTLVSLRAAHDELRRYAERAAESAAERERIRIATDLHDAIGHSLTALNVQLQSATRLRASRPAEADALIDAALDLGQSALASVRRTVGALRADPLEREPLDLVLQRIVARHEASDGPQIDASVESWRDAPATATVVARIAEEALVNAIKRAGATRVRLSLRTPAPGAARLEISDDGCGFDPREQSSGHGLQIMLERARAAGIDLAFESAPGDGTRVLLHWRPAPALA